MAATGVKVMATAITRALGGQAMGDRMVQYKPHRTDNAAQVGQRRVEPFTNQGADDPFWREEVFPT